MSVPTGLGIDLAVGDAAQSIQEACSVGRMEDCRKARVVETGKAIGSIGGASAIGGGSSIVATSICVIAFGIPTGGAGAIGCAIAGAAAGGYVGGEMGKDWGGRLSEIIYESRT